MADADTFVRVPADGAGKKIYHQPKTVGADAVHVNAAMIADGTDPTIHAPVSATLGLSVNVAAMPATAATGAKQDTGNASLTSIDGKLPALGQALAAASTPVVLTAAQLSTLTPTAGLTDAQLRATPVPVSGSVTATGPLTDAQLRASVVPVSAVLTAGAALVGSVGIDQTTPGTTNKVTIGADVVTVLGAKTNNAAAPGATNNGVLPAVATAAPPDYVEGYQVALSTDLTGAARVNSDALGDFLRTQNELLVLILSEMRLQTTFLQIGLNVREEPETYRKDPSFTALN